MRIAITLLAMLFCTMPCVAQDKPDFSGTWKLNLEKSDYGDMQGPSIRTDIIEQDSEKISDHVRLEGRKKSLEYTLTFTADGKETVYAKGSEVQMGIVSLQAVSALWQGHMLVVTEKLKFQDSDLIAKNTYELSNDKQELTIQTSLRGEGVMMKMVFDKVSSSGKEN
jgi:hypothetical protein